MHAHDALYTTVPTCIRTPGGFELVLETAVDPKTGFGELVALLHRQRHEFPVPLAELHTHDDLPPLYALVDSATDRVVHTIHDAASWDRARAHVLHGGQMSHYLLVHHRPTASSTSTTITMTSIRATKATTREIGLEVEILTAAGRVRAPASAVVASPGYEGLLFAVAAGVHAHFPLVVPSAPLQLVLFDRHGAGLGSIASGPVHLHDLDAVARAVAVFRVPPSIVIAGHRACDCVGHGTVHGVGAGHGSGGHPVGGHIHTGIPGVTELVAVGHAGDHAVNGHVGYEHGHAVGGHTGYEHGHALGGHTGHEHGHAVGGHTDYEHGYAMDGHTGHEHGHAMGGHTDYEHGHAVGGHTGHEHGHSVGGHTGHEHGHAVGGHTGHTGYEHGHAVGGHTGYERGHSPNHGGHSGHSGHPAGEHKSSKL